MYLCLNKLGSKVWKNDYPNFLYNVLSWMKVGVIFPSILGSFSFISNATNFFHSLNRFFFFFNVYTLLVFFKQVPYMQISDMISGVNIIGRKVSVSSVNGPRGFGGVLRPQWGF